MSKALIAAISLRENDKPATPPGSRLRGNGKLARGLAAALVAAAIAGTTPAIAHHGWSEYDSTQPLTLTGTIREAGYEHPHGHVVLVTPQKTWSAVLAPPSRMEARGLPSTALKPGVTATVVGYPNRNKPEEMRAERITIDGKTIELR